jgi:hypothetical protein
MRAELRIDKEVLHSIAQRIGHRQVQVIKTGVMGGHPLFVEKIIGKGLRSGPDP